MEKRYQGEKVFAHFVTNQTLQTANIQTTSLFTDATDSVLKAYRGYNDKISSALIQLHMT